MISDLARLTPSTRGNAGRDCQFRIEKLFDQNQKPN